MKPFAYDLQLLTLHLEGWKTDLRLSSILLLVILLIVIVILAFILIPKLSSFRQHDVELNIKLGGVGSVKIKPNNQVRQIAHKAWVELVTRKAGILVDRDNDIIADIYGSWYELFKEIRILARDVPAQKLTDSDTKQLVDVLLKTLNQGLRPHLTQWQAKYKRWYEMSVAKDKKSALTPQDIQKKYPQYEELVDDMLKVNKLLVDYAGELRKLLN